MKSGMYSCLLQHKVRYILLSLCKN
jgi:hypothetical protein